MNPSPILAAFETCEHLAYWESHRSMMRTERGGTVFVQSEATAGVGVSIVHNGVNAGFNVSVAEARVLAAEIVKACDAANAKRKVVEE